MDLSRRQFVVSGGTVVVAGLAGCGGDGAAESPMSTPEPTQAETDTPTPTATETPSQQVLVDEEVHLEPGKYETYRAYHDSEFTISYEFEVVSGPAVDVFVVAHGELSKYEAGQRFDTVAESMASEGASNSVEVSSGTYHVVLDNTDSGEASPQVDLNREAVDVQMRATSDPVS